MNTRARFLAVFSAGLMALAGVTGCSGTSTPAPISAIDAPTETPAQVATTVDPPAPQAPTTAPSHKPSRKHPKHTAKPSPALTHHPTHKPKPPKKPVRSVYYANCSAARAAGAAPLHRGDPGYRSGLDRDNDGSACE